MATVTDLIPDMTSNTAPSGVASASNANSDAWKALDKNVSSFWGCDAGVAAATFTYQFSSSQTCNGYALTQWGTYRFNMPADWTFLGSNTGAFAGEETLLDTVTGQDWEVGTNTRKTFVCDNSTSFTYYRLDITITKGGSSTNIAVAEIEMGTSELIDMTGTATLDVDTLSLKSSLSSVSLTGTATLATDMTRRTRDQAFLFVQSLQLSEITKTFTFVEKIEQVPTATIIKRINS